MIKLPDVTLIALSSIEIWKTMAALEKSREKIDFGAVKLVSHAKPDDLPSGIAFEQCQPINSAISYSAIVFNHLTEYVDTNYCLVIQYDSWVINPELWSDNWLEYDYIGAPWGYKEDAYICHDTGEHVRVGNGGFSLRSKKILNAPWAYGLPLLQEQGWYNEDGNLCVYHRKKMLELGVKYAPVEIAAKFSYENPVPENIGVKSFGFHKNYPHYE
jgi:hypothetical protein